MTLSKSNMKNFIALFTLLVLIALVVGTLVIEINSFIRSSSQQGDNSISMSHSVMNYGAMVYSEEAAKVQETVISKLAESKYYLRSM